MREYLIKELIFHIMKKYLQLIKYIRKYLKYIIFRIKANILTII